MRRRRWLNEDYYPPWQFMPPTRGQLDYDDIREAKRFWEEVEKEYKEKNKPKETKKNWWETAQFYVVINMIGVAWGLILAKALVIAVK